MNNDYLGIDSHKMQYHSDRVAEWKAAQTIEKKLEVAPIYIEISPIGSCNHRCTFCAVDYIGYKSIKLDPVKLELFINQLSEAGVRSIMFAGEGEPTLYPKLSEIINWTKASGIDVAITTNGTGLTEKLVRGCLNSISWIKLSINAGDEETYAKIHQTQIKDWNRVWNNVAFAVAYRSLNPQIKTKIGVQCLLLPENCDEIELLITQCVTVGVDYLVIKPYSQHLSSINKIDKEWDYKWIDETMKNLERKYSNESFQVIWRASSAEGYGKPTEERGYEKCYSTPFLWAYLMANGDLYSCSAYLLNDEFNLGNINERSFSEIWKGSKRIANIQKLESLDIKECRKNCRMDKVNKYLWDIKNPSEHKNFI